MANKKNSTVTAAVETKPVETPKAATEIPAPAAFDFSKENLEKAITTAKADVMVKCNEFNKLDLPKTSEKVKSDAIESANSAVVTYNVAVLDLLYSECMKEANPMAELIKRGFWESMSLQQVRDKDTKEVTEIKTKMDGDTLVNVTAFDAWAVEKESIKHSLFNGHAVAKAITDYRKLCTKAAWLAVVKNNEAKAEKDREKMTAEMEVAANTTVLDGNAYQSKTAMVNAMRQIMNEICFLPEKGKPEFNQFKAIGIDYEAVMFAGVNATKKLGFKIVSDDQMLAIITKAMYRIINGLSYSLDFNFNK